MTPTFNNLPTIHCPEWAPKAVRAEFDTLQAAQKDIEAKRSEVLAALEAAKNQDLAVFTPVQFNPRPLLQQELLFRRSYDAFLKSLNASAAAYREKCQADAERAREEVKSRLIKAGYADPAVAPGRGSYSPEMIQRHDLVRSAAEKSENAGNYNTGGLVRENQQAVTDLESKLRALLVSPAA